MFFAFYVSLLFWQIDLSTIENYGFVYNCYERITIKTMKRERESYRPNNKLSVYFNKGIITYYCYN